MLSKTIFTERMWSTALAFVSIANIWQLENVNKSIDTGLKKILVKLVYVLTFQNHVFYRNKLGGGSF